VLGATAVVAMCERLDQREIQLNKPIPRARIAVSSICAK